MKPIDKLDNQLHHQKIIDKLNQLILSHNKLIKIINKLNKEKKNEESN